jgi:NadR type nicotinamide-nucleotide adenylyltransferase
MSTRFRTGLVVGKFSPLHQGHEFVIRRALAECDEVLVLSYSNPEFLGCEAAKRSHWISQLFPAVRHFAASSDVPPNDADELVHRRFCANLCHEVFNATPDVVFTSEGYGDGFAAELARCFGHPVAHVLVDQARMQFPISGTRLREDIHAHRAWLSAVVYSSFVKRICFLGGESSGKSTLAEDLAVAFQTCHVPEFGRELWEEKRGILCLEDMLHIAETQVRREEQMVLSADRYLFCDTSPLTTLFYSQHLFRQADPELERLAQREYDLTILCAPDFPFVQDGTRQPETFRTYQHDWYLRELERRKIRYHLVTGSVQERIRQISAVLEETLEAQGQCPPVQEQS